MATLPKIEEILDRQVRSWEIRRRLADEVGAAARQALAHLEGGPWITVSKQLGSGGIELAGRLAGELEWQVFDREILTTIAEHTHTQETVLKYLDERAIGPINDYLASELEPGVPGRVPFVQEMIRVIWGLAKQGSAIIIGRGANWFLDSRFGLRLRVVAPLDGRVARMARQEGIDGDAAERKVRENDRQQEGFIRKTYGAEINDPTGYDLVLNLGALDPETAVQTAMTAFHRKLGAAAGE